MEQSGTSRPPPASFEHERLAALRALQILDTEPEREFDDIARIAATLCETPIALVSLIDGERQWCKASVGADIPEIARDLSFCSFAIETPERFLEIPDTAADERFAENPYVAGPPHVRFYAGHPLIVDGFAVGTLCAIDVVPRTLAPAQHEALAALARGVVTAIKNRRATAALIRAEARRTQSERDLAVFSAAFAHAHDGILVFTKRPSDNGWPRITFANAAWGRMIGRDPSTTIGRSAASIASVARNAAALERIDWTTSSNLPTAQQIALPRADGGAIEVEVTVAALPATLKGLHWVAIMRDLSDRVATENARREVQLARLERAALGASERRLRDLFEQTPAISYTLDRELRFLTSIGGGLRALGFEPGELVGRPLVDFLPGGEAASEAHLRALAGESLSYEEQRRERRYQTFLAPVRDDAGRIEGVGALSFDMTEHRASVEELAATREQFARTQRTAQIGTWFHDIATDRRTYSSELFRIFGVAQPSDDREAFVSQIVAEDRVRVRKAIAEAYLTARDATLEYRIESGVASRWVVESIAFSVDANGFPRHADGIVIDITERREAELEIARLADTDGVTGLPNRAALVARIAAGGAAHAESLIVLDLDRFGATNETFGHTIGDRLLREAAMRIGRAARGGFAARIDGDAFAVLVPPGRDPRAVGADLETAFATPFVVDRHRIFTTVSLGIVACDGTDAPETVLRAANVAVSAAKAAGGGRTVAFDDAIAVAYQRRVSLDRDMRGALDRFEFTMVYQPIVDGALALSRIEALMRWTHPLHGSIPPNEFVPIAEDNGQIVPLGRFALQTACAELRALRLTTGRPDLRVAVNVSAQQFADPELLTSIDEALAAARLEPSALELEITESTIVRDPARAGQLLGELRAAGVTISIDDFGTGFSSLASLQRLPIDTLKIDRSFIAAIPADEGACAIVEAILALAKRLSLEVVAEGVETVEQATFLRERGCGLLQGYYFGRPGTPASVAAGEVVRRSEAASRP